MRVCGFLSPLAHGDKHIFGQTDLLGKTPLFTCSCVDVLSLAADTKHNCHPGLLNQLFCEYVGSHCEAVTDPEGDWVPAGHGSHESAPPAEYVPLRHG